MRRSLVPLLLGAAAVMVAARSASAHAIQTDLTLIGPAGQLQASLPSSGGRLELSSHYSTGRPASDAAVRLIPALGGTPIELGRTDSQGRLAIALPAGTRADAEIQVDAGAGHRDWIEISELGRPNRQAAQPFAGLHGMVLGMAPLAALGLLGGLARLNRPRG